MSKAKPNFQSLIDNFNLTTLDEPTARALCYWPVYVGLMGKVQNDVSLNTQLLISLKDAKFEKELDWISLLKILLSSALDDSNYEIILNKLKGIFMRQEKGKSKPVDPDDKETPHFYYLFAASFQNWIIFHAHHTGKNINECKHDLCYSCKANVDGNDPSISMLDIFYKNCNKTYTTFKTIFGVSADETSFENTEDIYSSERDITEIIKIKNNLFKELKWLIKDIKYLVYVNSRIAEIEKIVEEGVKQGKPPEEWNKSLIETSPLSNGEVHNIWDEYIKRLRILQLSCFIQGEEPYGGKIKYNEVSQNKDIINGILPHFHYEENKEEWKYNNEDLDIFYKIIGELYKEGFKKDFLGSMEKMSPTDIKKARGIIFIPDGEITFFHLLYVIYRLIQGKDASFKGKRELQDLDSEWHSIIQDKKKLYVDEQGEIDWNRDGWWIKLTDTSYVTDIFSEKKDEIASKCSALISYLYMTLDRKIELNSFPNAGDFFRIVEKVKDTFCKFDNRIKINPANWLTEIINNLVRDFTSNVEVLKNIIDKYKRVQFLPEIILRKGDHKSHTLFFMPFGMEEGKLPMSMIAGTVRGVEANYLPFSSYRAFAHVYPVAQILRPIVTKMTKKAWEEIKRKEIKNTEKKAESDVKLALFDRIQSPLKNVIDSMRNNSNLLMYIDRQINPPWQACLNLSQAEKVIKIFDKSVSISYDDNKELKGIHDFETVYDKLSEDNKNKLKLYPEYFKWLVKIISSSKDLDFPDEDARLDIVELIYWSLFDAEDSKKYDILRFLKTITYDVKDVNKRIKFPQILFYSLLGLKRTTPDGSISFYLNNDKVLLTLSPNTLNGLNYFLSKWNTMYKTNDDKFGDIMPTVKLFGNISPGEFCGALAELIGEELHGEGKEVTFSNANIVPLGNEHIGITINCDGVFPEDSIIRKVDDDRGEILYQGMRTTLKTIERSVGVQRKFVKSKPKDLTDCYHPFVLFCNENKTTIRIVLGDIFSKHCNYTIGNFDKGVNA